MMNPSSGQPGAVACVNGGSEAPFLRGKVEFYQMGDRVLVIARISGLPRNMGTGFLCEAGERMCKKFHN